MWRQEEQRFKVILSFIQKVLGRLGYMKPYLNKILTPLETALIVGPCCTIQVGPATPIYRSLVHRVVGWGISRSLVSPADFVRGRETR